MGCAKAFEAEGTPPLVAEARKPYRTPIAQGTSPRGGNEGAALPLRHKETNSIARAQAQVGDRENWTSQIVSTHSCLVQLLGIAWGLARLCRTLGMPHLQDGPELFQWQPCQGGGEEAFPGGTHWIRGVNGDPVGAADPGFQESKQFGHDADVPVVQCVGEVVWMGCQST